MHFFVDNRPVYREGEKNKSFDNSLYFYSKFTSNCPICLFYHENPYIIPCGHSFCQACLKRLKNFSNNCPVCASFFWSSKPVKFFFFDEISSGITFCRLTTKDVSFTTNTEFYEYPYACYYYDNNADELLTKPEKISGLAELLSSSKITKTVTHTPNKLSEKSHTIKNQSKSPSVINPSTSRVENQVKKTSSSTKPLKISQGSNKIVPSLEPSKISYPFLIKKTNPEYNFTFYQSIDGQLYFLNPKLHRNYKSFPKFIYGQIKSVYACKGGECNYPELQHVPHHYNIYVVTIH